MRERGKFITPLGKSTLVIKDNHPKDNGVIVDSEVMENRQLSARAKGLYVVLVHEFLTRKKPIDALRLNKRGRFTKAIRELVAAGHVKIEGKVI